MPLRAALEDVSYSGPHAIRDFWAETTMEWSARELDLEGFEEEGDRVVSRGFLRATARASGAAVEMRIVATCTFRDGLITEIRVLPEQQP